MCEREYKMNSKETIIVLPDTIYIQRLRKHQDIITMPTEYNIYFENIIYPYNANYDVCINCKYGENLGNCWRLGNYDGEDDIFDFEVAVYNEYGEKTASKSVKIIAADKCENKETSVLFIGDSMTYYQKYIERIVHSLYNIKTIGSRSLDKVVCHEGRGGWSYDQIFGAWYDQFGLSPFLFPKGVDGCKYYGNKDFIDDTLKEDSSTYSHYGLDYGSLEPEMYFTKDKKLYKMQNDAAVLVTDKPEFEFDFKKYLERFNLEQPQIVSVLMGANDLQVCPYEESEKRIQKYISQTKLLAEKIHECSKDINIIINLPVLGAEQYAWGKRKKCEGTSKMYRYNIIHAAYKLLQSFDNRQNENIYISPMISALDLANGFSYGAYAANMHCEKVEVHQSNWVHPNNSGYFQMADALASVIEFVRSK